MCSSDLYFFYPLIGVTLVYLFLKYILKKPGNRGFVSILYSISKRNSIMRWHQMFSPIISSALTVGFGGSVGLEAPTAVSGSAIGSRLSKLLHRSEERRVGKECRSRWSTYH